jgi:hypothetical protein
MINKLYSNDLQLAGFILILSHLCCVSMKLRMNERRIEEAAFDLCMTFDFFIIQQQSSGYLAIHR